MSLRFPRYSVPGRWFPGTEGSETRLGTGCRASPVFPTVTVRAAVPVFRCRDFLSDRPRRLFSRRFAVRRILRWSAGRMYRRISGCSHVVRLPAVRKSCAIGLSSRAGHRGGFCGSGSRSDCVPAVLPEGRNCGPGPAGRSTGRLFRRSDFRAAEVGPRREMLRSVACRAIFWGESGRPSDFVVWRHGALPPAGSGFLFACAGPERVATPGVIGRTGWRAMRPKRPSKRIEAVRLWSDSLYS